MTIPARDQMRTMMTNSMRELLGGGYIASYYEGAVVDMIGAAEWYADSERRNAGRAALDAIWAKIDRLWQEDPTFTVRDCLRVIADGDS